MFRLIASIFETGFMVLEPAYRTYKVLKSGNQPDTKADDQTDYKTGYQANNRTMNRPGIMLNSRLESKPDGRLESETDNRPEKDSENQPNSQADKDSDQHRLLLMHWIVYAAFQAVECVTQPWLPFFPAICIVTVMWLRYGGTEIVYQKLVEPFLIEHEQAVDQVVDRFEQAKSSVATAAETAQQAMTGDYDSDTEVAPAVFEPQLESPEI